jgi:hypothetical protein
LTSATIATASAPAATLSPSTRWASTAVLSALAERRSDGASPTCGAVTIRRGGDGGNLTAVGRRAGGPRGRRITATDDATN